MALEAWELHQRQEGNIAAAEVAQMLRQKYGDIALPKTETNGTTKTPTQILEFNIEARSALEKRGYLIYGLTGQSIKSLRESGRPIWTDWHQRYPEFESLTSRLSEVAINPDPKKFFLKDSNNKAFEEQLRSVQTFSDSLAKGRNRIEGVRAVLGEAADYCELAFLHLDRTGDRLFGENYNYDYTRTVTLVGSGLASVGVFEAVGDLCVFDWHSSVASGYLWVSPLVVPAEPR